MSTTDTMSVTTESDMVSISAMRSSSDPNDTDEEEEEDHSTIDEMAKLLGDSSDGMTTSTFEQTTSATSESDGESDESTTIASIGKSDAATKSSVQSDKTPSIETTVKDLNANDTTEAPAGIPEGTAKSTVKSSATTTSSRSRVVAKIDIESIRGRALNLTGNERRPSMPGGGLIYVTAPPHSGSFNSPANGPAMAMAKSAKSKIFSDDLSDVSMDNDSMDVHSSEHMAMMKMMTTKTASMKSTTAAATTTEATPLCQSKVGF